MKNFVRIKLSKRLTPQGLDQRYSSSDNESVILFETASKQLFIMIEGSDDSLFREKIFNDIYNVCVLLVN